MNLKKTLLGALTGLSLVFGAASCTDQTKRADAAPSTNTNETIWMPISMPNGSGGSTIYLMPF